MRGFYKNGDQLSCQLPKERSSRNYIPGDELLPIIYFVLSLPSHPKVLGFSIIIFIILCVLAVWQTYIILEKFNINFTLPYCPFYFIELYMTNSMLICLISFKTYIPLIKSFKTNFLWNFTTASDKLQRKILRECRYLQIFYGLELFFAACLLWDNFYIWAYDHSKYFMISPIIIKNFPAFSPYFHWVAIGLGSLTFITMVSPIWYTFYMLNYLNIQILMLTEKIICFKQQLDLQNTLDVIYDDEFQRNVTKCLKFFIRRHQKIIKANHILLVKGKYLNFLFFLSAILVSLYSIFTIYSDLYNRHETILSFFTFFFTVVITGGVGQHFENLSEDLADAVYSLEWYLWNHQNMKLFLILHQYTSCRIIKLPVPSYISCNVDLIKSFAKLTFSIANFLNTMSRQRR